MQWHFISADGIDERQYHSSSPVVSAKRFLNYLRRYKEIRPTKILVKNNDGQKWEIEVSWYVGKLKMSSFEGAEGEWWHIEKVTKL